MFTGVREPFPQGVMKMAQKGHWPFGQDGNDEQARELDRIREREMEREQARMAAEAAHQNQTRTNRLLVGGRAHTKKPGLS